MRIPKKDDIEAFLLLVLVIVGSIALSILAFLMTIFVYMCYGLLIGLFIGGIYYGFCWLTGVC